MDGISEECGFLVYEVNVLVESFERECFYVVEVDVYGVFERVVEVFDEVYDGGFF